MLCMGNVLRRRMDADMRVLKRLLTKQIETGGELGYFGLGEWWKSTFSTAERQYVERTFGSGGLPSGARPLTRDRGLLNVSTAAGLLTLLADRLSNRPEDRGLACRVLAKAEERALAEDDILGLHFVYHQMIRLHCRWKAHFADALDRVFAACHRQIRLAPRTAEAFRERFPDRPLPTHLGYLQAAGMLEQQNAFSQAIEVCRQAGSEGWSGNWEWRIQRMARRLPEERHSMKPISGSGMGEI